MNKKTGFQERRKARRYALQALYAWALSNNPLSEIETYFLIEHHEDSYDKEYFHTLLHEVPANLEEIERIMSPYLSRNLEDLGPIELSILRLSVFELTKRLEIPYKVVINEGLELGKRFASPDSHKFINGVLDKVAKEIRSLEI